MIRCPHSIRPRRCGGMPSLVIDGGGILAVEMA